MYTSRISLQRGHAQDEFTDHLYDPLRKTFLEDTTAKKNMLTEVAMMSKVSKQYAHIQNPQIAENTFIPEYARLRKCEDLSNLPTNTNFCVVNAEMRNLDPISSQELQRRLQGNRFKEEIIVYTYGDNRPVEQPIQIKTETVQPKPEAPPKLKSQNIEKTSRAVKGQPKKPQYNLFSMFDEGINNLMSGKSWSMPSNEIIASRPNKGKWQLKQNN